MFEKYPFLIKVIRSQEIIFEIRAKAEQKERINCTNNYTVGFSRKYSEYINSAFFMFTQYSYSIFQTEIQLEILM